MGAEENNGWLKALAFWTVQTAGQRATQRAIHAGVDAALVPVTSVAGAAREVTESALAAALWWAGSLIVTGTFNGICYVGEKLASSTIYALRSTPEETEEKEALSPNTSFTPV